MDSPNLVGTVGVATLLAAFFMNLFGFVSARSAAYQILNATGAGLSCYASYMIGFVPFVVLEATWALVAIIALVKSPGEN
jgi:hypothetical protein